MAAAGLGDDLLLANETVDRDRLRTMAECGARVTVAVDSPETVAAAAESGIREVLVDVDVGLPRCGCPPDDAGRIADLARTAGMIVRGVMGYEGHVVGNADRAWRIEQTERCMAKLRAAYDDGRRGRRVRRWHRHVRHQHLVHRDPGRLVHADGHGVREARPAVPSGAVGRGHGHLDVGPKGWFVADCGLKSLGMDHGDPSVDSGEVLFCSDEHVTIRPEPGHAPDVGDRVRIWPAHVDPTIALHERMHLVDGEDVVDTWAVDLRGW